MSIIQHLDEVLDRRSEILESVSDERGGEWMGPATGYVLLGEMRLA
jgi:hypothetical protein